MTDAGPTALLVTFGSVAAPRHGTAVRSRQTIATFARLGVPVAVVTTEEPISTGRVAEIDGVVAAGVPRRPPKYGMSLDLVRTVRRAAVGVDFVVLGSAVLLPAAVIGAPGRPIVWDANECETLLYGRLPVSIMNWIKRAVWFVLEWVAGRASRAVVVVSEDEAAAWRRFFPRIAHKIFVVPHTPGLSSAEEPGSDSQPVLGVDERSVLFVGSMVAKHNRAAAEWLVRVLAPHLPDGWTVAIAGPGSDAIVVPRTVEDRVTLLGVVGDIDEVIDRAGLCIAPLHAGAGVKTKVLQYLAVGKPIIGTPAAAEGLTGAPGMTVVGLEDMVEAVRRFADDPPLPARQLRLAAEQRRWVEQHHGATAVDERWADLLRDTGLVPQRPDPARRVSRSRRRWRLG